ncbi:hypothetical protein FPQ18DRAFT_344280 [Pyronema domesticum]|uniref:Similar to DNA damage-inducible protein 2 acc. no. P0CH63 n=1 Tax=Pyronema omphalodes (strain CBS 100304) TaxID=1076935 RepID=U4LDX6_PYROM|nr:hypothetical protein FPQ18DRAFT_344280 [Pyronema domesticum]CCX30073.1 Similar to DNA damage-inducible protein 2; acc. no. P0CH63 [Pyronema omphalodes CBS 100304]
MSHLDPAKLTAAGFLPAVPRNISLLFNCPANEIKPNEINVEDIKIPSTPLADAMTAYVKAALPVPTFNHSMRVYSLCMAILAQHKDKMKYDINFDPEVYYVFSLFHDLGTSMTETALSFEYAGGIHAREKVMEHAKEHGGDHQLLADSVCEAIIRHQDNFFGVDGGDGGKLSALTALSHITTLLDNTGDWSHLVHQKTYEGIVAKWPREGWSEHFRCRLAAEGKNKPWCHTTFIGVEEFRENIGKNHLNKYEQ